MAYFNVQQAITDGVPPEQIAAYMKQNGLQEQPTNPTSTNNTAVQPKSMMEGNADSDNLFGGNNLLSLIANNMARPFVKTGRNILGGAFEAGRAGVGALQGDNAYKPGGVYGIDTKTGKQGENPFLSNNKLKQFSEDPRKAILDQVKNSAAVASWAVPFGKGANILTKAVAPGAIVGGAQALPEAKNIGDVASAAVTGGITAGALHGASSFLRGAKNLITGGGERVANSVADRAAQGIGKATPSQFANAVEDSGKSVTDLVRKYFPKGGDYDTALGTVAERGNGGVLGQKMQEAEGVIQKNITGKVMASKEDLLTPLYRQRDSLADTIGNESKIKALDDLIHETEIKYPQGVTDEQLLKMKRAADGTFGKAVVEDTQGAIESQAQKILGNKARGILKSKIPEMADALETESDIYTLKPILNKARGIANTTGSTIRSGNLTNFDLSKPATWIKAPVDAALSNPKIASTVMQVGNKAGEGAAAATNPVLSKVGGLMPSIEKGAAALSAQPTNNVSQDTQAKTDQTNSNVNGNQNMPFINNDKTMDGQSQTQRRPLEGYTIDGKPISDGEANLIEGIANYKIDLSKVTSMRSDERTRIAKLVSQYDPDWDMTQYAARAALRKDFSSGKTSQNIRSLNTAIGHLQSLSNSGLDLGNTGLPIINTVKNAVSEGIGQPQVTKFRNAINAVAGEMSTVFKGSSGTDAEIKSWKDQMNSSESPDQIKQGIDQMIELMGSRLGAINSQWESGMKKPKDFQFLNNKSRAILTNLGVDVNAIDPVGSQQ